MTSVDRINDIERRGTLTYLVGTETKVVTGWFERSMDGVHIAYRPVHGRFREQLCRAADVLYFEASAK